MRLIDAMHLVDRSNENRCEIGETFQREVNEVYAEYDDVKLNTRLASYYLIRWMCTDEWVGVLVYLMDDQPVAVSTQMSRKSSVNFEWISAEAFAKVRQFVDECRIAESPVITILNPEEQLPDARAVSYVSQLIDRVGYYKGRKCEAVREDWLLDLQRDRKYDFKDKDRGTLLVTFEDGTKEWIKIEEFMIPLRLGVT